MSAQPRCGDPATDAHDDVERHSLLDAVVARDQLLEHGVDGLGLRLGEEADAAEIDTQHGDFDVAGEFGGAQERAVAAEHEYHLAAFGGAFVGVDDLDFDAERVACRRAQDTSAPDRRPRPQAHARPIPLSPSTFSTRRAVSVASSRPGVHDQQYGAFACHCGPSATARRTACSSCSPASGPSVRARRRRKYSTLPDGPGSGLDVTSTVCQPSSAARRGDRRAPRRPADRGSVTTPPGPTRSLPTSNCGFTMGTISASDRRAGDERGQHGRQRDERQVGDHEVDRSADCLGGQVRARWCARCTIDPRVRAQRPGQLAVADVGGDDLGGAAVQQHLGEAAGRGARVQASTAFDRRCRTRRGRRSACARRGRPRCVRRFPSTVSLASTATAVAGLAAGMPSMLTRPAPINSAACCRDRARPRRTSSASTRARRVTWA